MAEHDVSKKTAKALAMALLHREQLKAEQQDYAASPRPNLYAWYADEIAADDVRIVQLERFCQYEQYGVPAGCLVEVAHDERVQLRGISQGTDQPEGYNHSFVCFKWMPDVDAPDTHWGESRSRREVSVVKERAWMEQQLGAALLETLCALTPESNAKTRNRLFYAELKRDYRDVYGKLIAMMDPQRQVRS